MIKDPPGHLLPIWRITAWLDLIYKSDLSPAHKLAGSVICQVSYFRKGYGLFTNTSVYTISRILNFSVDETKQIVDDLIEYGWLWDTGTNTGARRHYLLTLNQLPKEPRK